MREPGSAALDVEGPLERADPEAEALVDRRLRRPQDRHRLTALARLVDQPAHDLAQDPASTMAGRDADGGDPDRPDVDPAGHRQAERIASAGPDPGVAFDGADDAIGLELDPLELVFGVADFVGEGGIEDAEPRP